MLSTHSLVAGVGETTLRVGAAPALPKRDD